MKKISAALVLFSLCALSFSCKNKKSIDINCDGLELSPDIKWALIVEPYVAYRSASGYENHVLDHGRRGDILQLIGSDFVYSDDQPSNYVVWYKFEKGWLSESDVKLYDNKFKAENAAKKLKK